MDLAIDLAAVFNGHTFKRKSNSLSDKTFTSLPCNDSSSSLCNNYDGDVDCLSTQFPESDVEEIKLQKNYIKEIKLQTDSSKFHQLRNRKVYKT